MTSSIIKTENIVNDGINIQCLDFENKPVIYGHVSLRNINCKCEKKMLLKKVSNKKVINFYKKEALKYKDSLLTKITNEEGWVYFSREELIPFLFSDDIMIEIGNLTFTMGSLIYLNLGEQYIIKALIPQGKPFPNNGNKFVLDYSVNEQNEIEIHFRNEIIRLQKNMEGQCGFELFTE